MGDLDGRAAAEEHKDDKQVSQNGGLLGFEMCVFFGKYFTIEQ